MTLCIWKHIRFARKRAGLTQTEIAKACGVSQVAVTYWEKPPTADHANELGLTALVTIARLTGYPTQWFFTDGEPTEPEPAFNPTLPPTPHITAAAVASEPTSTSTPPPPLTVTPSEFITVVSGCVHLAQQMGLTGDRAVRAADHAAATLIGRSPLQVLGVEMG